MLEIKTLVSLLAYQDIDRKDDLARCLGENYRNSFNTYIEEYSQKPREEISKKALLELRHIISKNYVKIYNSFHPTWLEYFFKNESRETISTFLKFVPLEMSGALLSLFSEEDRNEILQKIPSSFVSREIMEILKYCIIYEYGSPTDEELQLLQNDQILRFLLQGDTDIDTFLWFVYSYEMHSLIQHTGGETKESHANPAEQSEKYMNWLRKANVPVKLDAGIFSSLGDYSLSLSRGYLLIPFIRLFVYLKSKKLLETSVNSISYRMEKDAGSDFLKFCEMNRDKECRMDTDHNTMRISECIYHLKLFKSEA